MIAAFLWAQLEEAESITNARLKIWDVYHSLLAPLEESGLLRRPIIPSDCQHNAHMYYILLNAQTDRQAVLSELKRHEIYSVFHYVPLHSSPAGERYSKVHGSMEVTNTQSERLLRLPMWVGLEREQQQRIVDTLLQII